MSDVPNQPGEIPRAPEAFRAVLAELAEVGMTVARLIGRAAESEIAMAEASAAARAAEGGAALAVSLAEAIEADRSAIGAAAARGTFVARVEVVTRAFVQVSRAIRRTVLLAERLDRGWARRSAADDRHAMAKRQIARGVADAIAGAADGARAEAVTESLAERLEAMDTLDDIGSRPAEELIGEICRDLGVDPVRMRLGTGGDEVQSELRLPGACLHEKKGLQERGDRGAGHSHARASPSSSPSGRGAG